MLNTILVALLSFNIFFSNGTANLLNGITNKSQENTSGTLEKMMATSGNVAVNLDLNRLNGGNAKGANRGVLNFEVERDSFFTVMVFNGELRGALPGTMKIIPQNSLNLPAQLSDSLQNLVFEKTPYGELYEFVIRDEKSGFVFFNVEGHEFVYDVNARQFGIQNGRLLMTSEFAEALGRPNDVGYGVGEISINTTMRATEVSQVFDGEVMSENMPANDNPDAGTVPGPDVVVGDVIGLAQFGTTGTQVGLAVGTDSCNYGTVDLNWYANPSNDHPVIPQNLYRMSGGANNDTKFEQIGQSSVKHAFTALTQNLCGLGCNGVGGNRLGSGCSDPYSAGLNAGPNLGSRAWINPFTGAYPRNDSSTPNNNHSGHNHNGAGHRILTESSDLNPANNTGATYYAEAQYVTPHEYVWCQANPTQCNMYNNVSYRRYNVSGSGTSYSFSPVGSTVRTKSAISAWTGATLVEIKPDPGNDGIGTVGYKVTNPSPGVWHYEYAIYNQNIDRAIQSFSVPVGAGVTLSNIGFYAPPQHPGSTGDGTVGNTGFSNAPWTQAQTSGSMTWNAETFAQNPNSNSIRWGTMYNFRFDSNVAPQTVTATVGFLKTGAPITVQVQGPGSQAAVASAGGRVMTASGRGIFNARVTLMDLSGNTRTAITNPFGYYRFDGIPTGGNYTIGVRSKSYTFTSQSMQINGNMSGVNFIAQ